MDSFFGFIFCDLNVIAYDFLLLTFCDVSDFVMIYSAVNIKTQFKSIGSHDIVCNCITLDIHQYSNVLHVPPSQYFAEHLMT